MNNHRDAGSEADTEARKPYVSPRLALTANLSRVAASPAPDMSPGVEDTQQDCWIARAVYGHGDARWMVFRAWLTDEAPGWLRAAYLRFGPRLGPWIARRAWARRALRPIMDRVVVTKLRRLSAAIA